MRLTLASALLTLADALTDAPTPRPTIPARRYTRTGAVAPEAAHVGVVVSVWV